MKLRNMTGIYLSCKGQMLLLYRQGGRVVSNQWVASAGGHFEKEELNDPEACVLRELREELNLSERSDPYEAALYWAAERKRGNPAELLFLRRSEASAL